MFKKVVMSYFDNRHKDRTSYSENMLNNGMSRRICKCGVCFFKGHIFEGLKESEYFSMQYLRKEESSHGSI